MVNNFGKTVTSASRFILYGKDTYNARKQPTVGEWAWGIAQNLLRKSFGLHAVSAPGLIDFLRNQVTDWLMEWLSIGDDKALPDGWPKQVFRIIDEVVKARGGQVELSGGLKVPAFSLDPKSARTTRTLWTVNIPPVNESCDFEKIKKLERAIENALARKVGKSYNIRILDGPERIEIDNPEPPTISIKEHWSKFTDGTIKEKCYVLGIEAKPQGEFLQYNRLTDANEFSMAVFGASGSGKTQAILSALLTACATTSPEHLAVIVIDPKSLDFPVDGLPHLAVPVIRDAIDARVAVLNVLAEMDRRKKQVDRKAIQKHILIVCDELPDLLAVQEGTELEDALFRLGNMGRAWGFSMIIGAQRAVNESFPRRVHAQIPARWVGRVLNASEAQFAAGMESDANKLPGRGAAMIYEPSASAVRIQTLFVADAKDSNYAKHVKPFIDDISKRWAGKRAHWDGKAASNSKPEAQTQSEAKTAAPRLTIDEQEELLSTLSADQYKALLAHCKTSDSLSRRKMREVLLDNGGARLSEAKEKALHAALLSHFEMA